MPYKDGEQTDEAQGIQEAIKFAYKMAEGRKSFVVDKNGRQDALTEKECDCIACKQLLKEFFAILDIEEIKTSGRIFHPNRISTCRVMDGEKMNKIIASLKILSQR